MGICWSLLESGLAIAMKQVNVDRCVSLSISDEVGGAETCHDFKKTVALNSNH